MRTIILLLLAIFIVGGCGGSQDIPDPQTRSLWDEVVECLSDTSWVNPYNGHLNSNVPLIEPEVKVVNLPCDLEIAGCLIDLFLAVPQQCVGVIEVYPDYNNEVLVHEFYHSIHAQNHCGLIGSDINMPDKNHESELFQEEFKCNQRSF